MTPLITQELLLDKIAHAQKKPASHLDLSGLGMNTWPELPIGTDQVEHLDLSRNRIQQLPVDFFKRFPGSSTSTLAITG